MSEIHWYFTRPHYVMRRGIPFNLIGVFRSIAAVKGLHVGRIPVPGIDLDLVAVRFDSGILSPTQITGLKGKLQAHDNNEIFDVRAGLGTTLGSWTRKAAMQTKMAHHLVDTTDIGAKTPTVRHVLRSIGQLMMVYRKLGGHFPAMNLDDTFDSVPLVRRESFIRHVKGQGLANAHMPADSTKWRAIYKKIITEGDPNIWGTDPNSWVLGHPESHLRV